MEVKEGQGARCTRRTDAPDAWLGCTCVIVLPRVLGVRLDSTAAETVEPLYPGAMKP